MTTSLIISVIDECSTDPHPCQQPGDIGACTEDPAGGYTCSCADGYALFTVDGTAGFSIPEGEDGTRAGDLYRINHTCVRKFL